MALKASALKVGDTHKERVVENLSRTQIVQYAGASGDYNPLHTDEVYTTQVAGYPSVFAHGMLTMGLTSKMLTNYVGAGPADEVRRAVHQSGVAGRYAGCDRDGRGDPRRGRAEAGRSEAVDDQPGRQGSRERQRDGAAGSVTLAVE